ncbi:MAG: hypothetical protein JNJ56_14190 [Ignavibacteria bacterium]|nr:hypothetical protein [Ignavibacteria bacterium]
MINTKNKNDLKSELKRKTIHLLSSAVPFSYYYFERNMLLIILFATVVLMILIDFFRKKDGIVRDKYNHHLGDILRSHESDGSRILFTGGTYIVISFFLCILIFEKNIAILSMLIIVFSDTAAAITGKFYGRHFIGKKTIEGSFAFFITGLIIFILVVKNSADFRIFQGVIALFMTTLFELIPLKIDDNISVPLFFGTVFSLISKTDFLI